MFILITTQSFCTNSTEGRLYIFYVSISFHEERTSNVIEKVDVKTEVIKEIKEDVGDVKHRLERIEFMFAMTLKRQGENPEDYVIGNKLKLDLF